MNKKDEKSYPIAVKIREEQNYFIAELKNNNLRILNNNEINTTITETLELNIDELIGVADLMIERIQDATRDQLTYALLQSIASTSKTKQMRKIANKLLKKVGKCMTTFFVRHQKETEKMMMYIVKIIVDDAIKRGKEKLVKTA